MYLAIILIPLLGSIFSGLFGRKLGAQGSQFITTFGLIFTCLLAFTAFYEVGLNHSPVSIDLFSNLEVNLAYMSVIPIVIFENADSDRSKIISENKNKAGIYLWQHKESGKRYVGSAKDLSNRLKNYFNLSYITYRNSGNMYINRALLSHGYSNFSLSILEYIDISKLSASESRKIILEREQYYLDLLKPEYNTLKTAGSPLGFKHSEKTILEMSETRKGVLKSEDHKIALKEARKGIIYSDTHKTNMSIAIGTQINVYSSDGVTLVNTFSSARKAAEHFKVTKDRILRYARNGNLFLDEWILSISPKDEK